MPAVAQRLIAANGWRMAFVAFACLVLFILLPVVAVFLKGPSGAAARSAALLEGSTSREIWRDRSYWMMVIPFFLAARAIHACIIHMPQIIGDLGGKQADAALATSVIGAGLLVGRVGAGWFLDRYFAPPGSDGDLRRVGAGNRSALDRCGPVRGLVSYRTAGYARR
jgi:fucose permease